MLLQISQLPGLVAHVVGAFTQAPQGGHHRLEGVAPVVAQNRLQIPAIRPCQPQPGLTGLGFVAKLNNACMCETLAIWTTCASFPTIQPVTGF